MSKRMKTAFWCYLLSTLILAAGGFTYLLRSEFMPYHSVAVGMPWGDLDPSFQVLILGLMKAVGGSCIAVVFFALILLFMPFRQGILWVRWAIPAGGLINTAGILYAILYVGVNTPANPPWIAAVVGALLLVAGFIFSLGQPKYIGT